MESNSQYGGFPHDSSFISLSIGGVCQGNSGDELTRDRALNMKSQSWGWMAGNGTYNSGTIVQNQFSFFEFSKEGKGNRSDHHRSDIHPEDNLGLVLGLGRRSDHYSGGNSAGSGTLLGTLRLEGGGQQDSLTTDLGLGLTRSRGCELTHDCFSPKRMAFQASSRGLKDGIDRMKGSNALASDSGENTCGMDLELGLSGNSLSADSDCLSGMPLAGNSGGDAQDSRSDVMAAAPLVDEGSTSGRWIKSGGYIASLLHYGHARVTQTSNLKPSIRVPEDTTETDPFISSRTPTVSASACETGFSSETTAPASSKGTLAGTSDRSSKTCKFKGCGKGARGASGLCIAHGGGRRCQRPNCNKGAEGRTMYCKAHGGGRRCQNLGCIKSAEGKTDYCIGHGGGRRCNHEGCNKAARGRSGLCIRHGGGKRCQKEGCTKSAEGFTGLCISHGGGRRCQYPGCGKGAQGSTMFCKAHGGGRRCVFEGCTKGAEGSTPLCKAHGGGKRCMYGGGTCTKSVHGGTLFCVAHGGGKRCAVPGCSKSARGRTDYCVRHGGGKRCKFENCSRSAQGSTDFCKAHGGGKRCSWCQEGSIYSGRLLADKAMDHLKGPCDRFARGKTGLCAAHSALMQQLGVSWDGISSASYSKGTTPDLLHEPVPKSLYNDLYPQPQSDLSEQSSHCAPGDDNDEQPSHNAAAQFARSSLEGSWRDGHYHVESESPCMRGSKAIIASRRDVALDLDSQDISFSGNGKDVPLAHVGPSACWFSFPQHSLHHTIVSAGNMSNNTAASRALLTNPYERFDNRASLPEPASFFSTHLVQHLHDACPDSASAGISNTFSSSVPEERVHGGGLMALLVAREAADHTQ